MTETKVTGIIELDLSDTSDNKKIKDLYKYHSKQGLSTKLLPYEQVKNISKNQKRIENLTKNLIKEYQIDIAKDLLTNKYRKRTIPDKRKTLQDKLANKELTYAKTQQDKGKD